MNVINIASGAFNTKQACAITDVTPKQVVYWDALGIVKPSVSPATGRGSQRLYSYGDLVALSAVRSLRDQGVSLQKIRKCVLFLRRHLPDVSAPLKFCALIADSETVYLVEDEQALIDTVTRQGQRAFLQLSIAAIDRELRQRVLRMTRKRVEKLAVGDYAYQVVIEADEESGGYVAEVAGLPGCITQGDTLEQVMEMAEDAIATYLEAVDDLKGRGVVLPVKRRRAGRTRRA